MYLSDTILLSDSAEWREENGKQKKEAFGANMLIVGVIFCAVFGAVICGGIKRIASVAEYMAPIMCVVYVVLAVGVIGMNLSKVPVVLATIVSSAFGLHPVFGAVIGSAISWGVKRGIYSNEAGQGSGSSLRS